MPSISDLFKPRSVSVRQSLSGAQAYAIPIYQRSFRWDQDKIDEFMESVLRGIERLAESDDGDDTATFVGAIITLDGVADQSADSPGEAVRVIDGQQRITTLVMMLLAGHDFLRQNVDLLTELSSNGCVAESTEKWLAKTATVLMSQLEDSLFYDQVPGSAEFPERPRIVREQEDRWADNVELARYHSPIAHLLDSYMRVRRGTDSFLPTAPVIPEESREERSSTEHHESLISAYSNVVSPNLSKVSIGQPITTASDQLFLEELFYGNPDLLTSLFNTTNDVEIVAEDLATVGSRSEELAGILRVAIYLRFLLDWVALSDIRAKSEGYALDLFDALNAGGEPLTALETFRPLIIRDYSLKIEGSSESKSNIDKMETLFEQEKLKDKVGDTVVSIGLAEDGRKLANERNEQRRWLRRRYEAASPAGRSAFLGSMLDTTLAYQQLRTSGVLVSEDGDEIPLDEETRFCLESLKQLQHWIVVAPVSRYASAVRFSRESERLEKLENFQGAVKAMTSFSFLWRSVKGGAREIDAVYRTMMRGDLDAKKSTGWTGISRTAPGGYESREVVPSSDLGGWLRARLNEATKDVTATCESWCEGVFERDFYSSTKTVSKFLLLLANDAALPVRGSALLKDGKHGKKDTQFVKRSAWTESNYMTLEHIAPQTDPSLDWDVKIYQEPDAVDWLGNLTLCPLAENIQLGNRSWSDKRRIYAALSAESVDDVDKAFEGWDTEAAGLPPSIVEKIREDGKYLPTLASIAGLDGDWSLEVMRARSKDLLERSWVTLDPWLDG